MNRNPIFPNWQLPRRQPFCARRGIALLRALRLRLAEETVERSVQLQFEFGYLTKSRWSAQRPAPEAYQGPFAPYALI